MPTGSLVISTSVSQRKKVASACKVGEFRHDVCVPRIQCIELNINYFLITSR